MTKTVTVHVDKRVRPIVGASSLRTEALGTMEILLDKRSVKLIRQSAADAVEDGDTETLREDVLAAFSDEQVEEIERRIEGDDFFDFLGDVLDEWDGEEVDELFEILESHLSEVGIELAYGAPSVEEEEEEDEDEVDEDEDEDEDFDSDDDDEEALDDDLEVPDEEL